MLRPTEIVNSDDRFRRTSRDGISISRSLSKVCEFAHNCGCLLKVTRQFTGDGGIRGGGSPMLSARRAGSGI
jgi:hypothetical protein